MKQKRHAGIVNIIENYNIETQEDLADKLKESGFNVTQATVSRDIRELKLTKISTDSGRQKYAVMSESKEQISERQKRVFKEGVISVHPASNILVIKTLIGMAMGVAASLDAMDNKEIIGTIAGDDTLMSVCKDEQDVYAVIERVQKVLNGE